MSNSDLIKNSEMMIEEMEAILETAQDSEYVVHSGNCRYIESVRGSKVKATFALSKARRYTRHHAKRVARELRNGAGEALEFTSVRAEAERVIVAHTEIVEMLRNLAA